jgi:hypothetical protein
MSTDPDSLTHTQHGIGSQSLFPQAKTHQEAPSTSQTGTDPSETESLDLPGSRKLHPTLLEDLLGYLATLPEAQMLDAESHIHVDSLLVRMARGPRGESLLLKVVALNDPEFELFILGYRELQKLMPACVEG